MGSCSSTNDIVVHERHGSTVKTTLRKLTEKDAWGIALAWGQQLQGCVVLVTDEDPVSASIISTFEWIRFRFDGTDKNSKRSPELLEATAAYARAATIAWFALSCCEGYSGEENPDFWRRVFLKLLLLRSTHQRLRAAGKLHQYEQAEASDPVRFFANNSKPFPRVRLRTRGAVNRISTANDIFLGRLAYADETRDAQLEDILLKLGPFIRGDRWNRRVPVVIDDVSCGLVPGLQSEVSHGPDVCEQVPASALLPFRQLHLISVRICEGRVLDLHACTSRQPSPETTIGCPLCCLLPSQIEQLQWRIRWRKSVTVPSQDMGISCSDLSLIRTARHLNMDFFIALDHERRSWAWLGYAIFHPDVASQSNLSSIELDLKNVCEEDLTAFGNMALGNNLLLNGNTGRPSHNYVEGRVRASTEIWSRSSLGEFTLQRVLEEDTWISLCVPSASSIQSYEWIWVVSPGFGFGWIHCKSITKLRIRSPSQSCVTSLRVIVGSGIEIDKNLVTRLLATLGSRLTTLHITDSAPVTDTTLHAIMQLCPSLKSLRVRHDGSLWAKKKRARDLPRIEELQLTVDAGLRVLNPQCLPQLKALHIVSTRPDSFRLRQDVVYAFLCRQQTLLYLRWSHSDESLDDQTSSEAWARDILLPHGFYSQTEEWAIRVTRNPLLLRLRFLSMVQVGIPTQIHN